MNGMIFDIQRFSIHDGPGIRTTVFFKGCSLGCRWCHNPEGISPAPVLSFMASKCIGCGYCFRACVRAVHSMRGGQHVMDRSRCEVCGRCATECHAQALELIGRRASVEEVMAEVLADRAFYQTSGGGMTLSGGEPLMQFEFALALLRAAKNERLHNCVETSSFVSWTNFERVLPLTDLFLCDVKDTNDARHLANTGVSNGLILSNIRRLHEAGANIRLRVPLVPGCNDAQDNLDGLARLAAELPRIEGVEILLYHKLGLGKHQRLGSHNPLEFDPSPTAKDRRDEWIAQLRQKGVRVLNE
jgi:pyruvate formate lyase activating enzyme